MATMIATVARQVSAFASGKLLVEATGSALALLILAGLQTEFKTQAPSVTALMPAYQPTLDPVSGKIVDRISPEAGVAQTRSRVSVATFVSAPTFVPLGKLPNAFPAGQRAELKPVAIRVATAEIRKASINPVPLPPQRITQAVALSEPVAKAPAAGDLPKGLVDRTLALVTPTRLLDSSAEALSSSREAIQNAASYTGNALARIYR